MFYRQSQIVILAFINQRFIRDKALRIKRDVRPEKAAGNPMNLLHRNQQAENRM
jgi:hypothetical protein